MRFNNDVLSVFGKINWLLLLSIVVIILFSIAIRSIWVVQSGDSPLYKWNDELSITTADAYHYATSVKLAVNNHIHNNREVRSTDMSSENGGIVMLGYLLKEITKIKIETITYYTPIVFSGFLGVIIFFVGRSLNLCTVGFVSALIAVSSKIYFIRTRGGYFDTDIFSLLVPMVVVLFLLKIEQDKTHTTATVLSIFLVFQDVLYINNSLVTGGIIIFYIVYVLITNQKSRHHMGALLIVLPGLIGSGVSFPYSVQMALILGAVLYLRSEKISTSAVNNTVLVSMLAILPLTNVVDRGWSKFTGYFLPGTTSSYNEHIEFSYTSFLSNVEEAQSVTIKVFSRKVSVSLIAVILSIVGLMFLVFKKREAILLVPVLVIGLGAFYTGERFTLYAVPPLSIGLAYLIVFISNMLKTKMAQYVVVLVMTAPVLYINVSYAYSYEAVPVVINDEALVLDTLGKISSPHDTVIAWWDYGYPIHYYSGRNTIAAGSASAQDMYILSLILSGQSNKDVYQLAKSVVSVGAEEIEKYMKLNYQKGEDLFGLKNIELGSANGMEDVYLYLPYRMLGIYSNIFSIGDRDIVYGRQNSHVLYMPSSVTRNDMRWILDDDLVVDISTGHVKTKGGDIKLSSYIEVRNGVNSVLEKVVTKYKGGEGLSLVYLKNYDKVIVVDKKILNSFFIQAFFFEQYNKDLFELSIRNRFALVYKVKSPN